jgi:hypothetical protein
MPKTNLHCTLCFSQIMFNYIQEKGVSKAKAPGV